MADESKKSKKPDKSDGKDTHFNEPLMNFELPEETHAEPEPIEEIIDSAEIVEEEVPAAEELETVGEPVDAELDDELVEVIDDEPEELEAVEAVEEEPDISSIEALEEDPEAAAAAALNDDTQAMPSVRALHEDAEGQPPIHAAASDLEEIDALEEAAEEEPLDDLEVVPSSTALAAPLVEDEEPIEAIEKGPAEQEQLDDLEVVPSSRAISAPLVEDLVESEEVSESAIDLADIKADSSSPTPAKKAVSESDIDLQSILGDTLESSAVDLAGAPIPTSVPVSPVPASGTINADEEVFASEAVDDEVVDLEKSEPSSKKGRKSSRELVGAGGGKRGGFVPFLLGLGVTTLLLGGGGAAAWYFNALPESPSADKKPAIKQIMQPPVSLPMPTEVGDDASELKKTKDALAELEAKTKTDSDDRQKMEQDLGALKSALDDAKVPQDPEKLKTYIADLKAAKNKPAESAAPGAPGAKANPADEEIARKFKELTAAYDALAKERDAAIKDRDDAVKAHDALVKDPNAGIKASDALAKERDAAIKKIEVVTSDLAEVQKALTALTKDRDALAQDRDLLKARLESQQVANKSLPPDNTVKKRAEEPFKAPAVKTPAVAAPEPNPLMAEKYYTKGLELFWARNYGAAEAELAKAVSASDDDARYRYFLGMSRYMQGNGFQAAQDFTRGAQLERQRHPSSRDVNSALERVQGSLRSIVNSYRQSTAGG